MKAYWGRRDIVPRILEMEVSGLLHAPAALPPEKDPFVPNG